MSSDTSIHRIGRILGWVKIPISGWKHLCEGKIMFKLHNLTWSLDITPNPLLNSKFRDKQRGFIWGDTQWYFNPSNRTRVKIPISRLLFYSCFLLCFFSVTRWRHCIYLPTKVLPYSTTLKHLFKFNLVWIHL